MPLLWAHSEYVKLHRSAADHRVFDLIEPVYERYVTKTGQRKTIEVWKPNQSRRNRCRAVQQRNYQPSSLKTFALGRTPGDSRTFPRESIIFRISASLARPCPQLGANRLGSLLQNLVPPFRSRWL